MIVVDAHIAFDAAIRVEMGRDIALEARQRVLQRRHVHPTPMAQNDADFWAR